MFGVAIFLGFLLFAVQIVTHLYATSAVSAAAYDAARMVAGHHSFATDEAERHVRDLLGDYGDDVDFDWSASTADQVALRVSAPTPARMIQGLAEATGTETIDRTVTVRVEEPR